MQARLGRERGGRVVHARVGEVFVYELQELGVWILDSRRRGDGVPLEASQRRGRGVARRRRGAALRGTARGERDELDGGRVELRAGFHRGGGARLQRLDVPPTRPSPFQIATRGFGRVRGVLSRGVRRRRRAAAGPVRIAHDLRESSGHLQSLQRLRNGRVPGQREKRPATQSPRGVAVGRRELLRTPQEHRQERADTTGLPQGGARGT